MSLKRPTQRARWAWGGSATLVQPPSGSAEAGFATEQRPPAQWFNWQFNTYGAWLDFLAGPDVEKWERNIWPGTPASDHFDAPSSIAFDVDTVTSDSSQTAAAFRYACVGDTIAAGAKMFVSQRGNDWEARASGMPSGVTGPYAIKALAAGRWLLGCLSSLGAALVYYGATDNGTAAGPMGAEGNTWSLAGMPVGATEVKAFAQLTSSSSVVAACATEAMFSTDGATWSLATFSSSPSGNGLDVVSSGVKFVWVSADGEVYNSPDGATWTDVATLAPGAGAWRLCAGAAGEVCAYRIGNSASVDIYRSTDSGVSWTAVAQTGDAPKRITKIAYRDGAWIVTGARSPWLWTSNDLAAWRTLYVPTMSASATAIPPALYNVAWDGGRWCAIGNGLVLTCGRAADPADGTYVASDTPSTLSDAGSLRGRLLSTDTPTDGQVLTWVAADNRWKPSTAGASLPTAAAASEVPVSTGAGTTYTARTMAQLRDLLFPTTAYTGASTGWTAVTGVGSAAASGTDYDLSLASGETGASEVYPTTDHPRLHRDVSAQLAGEADWSVTCRVGTLSGSAGARLLLAVGLADDSAGVQLVIAATGLIELGSWVSTTYGSAATAAGAIPVGGTGWARIVSRGGVISAQWGTGTSTDPPTSWTQVGGSVARAGMIAARLSLYVAQWSGAGITAAVDDVRVRAGA